MFDNENFHEVLGKRNMEKGISKVYICILILQNSFALMAEGKVRVTGKVLWRLNYTTLFIEKINVQL